MADETNEVVETTTEATEAKAEGGKEKKSVDVGKVMEQAKGVFGTVTSKITEFFSGDAKKSKTVLMVMMGVQALLAFPAGFALFVISALIAGVGVLALNAAIPTEKGAEEAKEETPAE